ncbi:MAG: hypoxanthine phosphoribosyltransferase [Huintestinicola sp.]
MSSEAVLDPCGYKGIKRVLISEEEIREGVRKAGRAITSRYMGKPLLLVSVLKGAFVFMADICREVKTPCEIGFLACESYGSGTVSGGEVKITMDLKADISKYHVVIIEDIIDTGRTLAKLVEMLRAREPLSLEVYALLDKPDRREVDFKADHTIFTVPDLFVVGYGLDCGELYRNLPFIAEAEL